MLSNPPPRPPGADFAQTLAFYRAGLEVAQKLSRTHAFWYVLPLSLGPLVIRIGEGIRRSSPMHAA